MDKMQWGTELWDKYLELCSHTNTGIEFLDSHVASFIKERGKIESEYAKSLRTLVKKYTPKDSVSTSISGPGAKSDKNGPANSGPVSIMSLNTSPEEEYTHMKAYKQVNNDNNNNNYYYNNNNNNNDNNATTNDNQFSINRIIRIQFTYSNI